VKKNPLSREKRYLNERAIDAYQPEKFFGGGLHKGKDVKPRGYLESPVSKRSYPGGIHLPSSIQVRAPSGAW